MKRSLCLTSFKHQKPEIGEKIFLIDIEEIQTIFPYGSVGEVEAAWVEYDEEGYETGAQFPYARKRPKNCKLFYFVEDRELTDVVYWMPLETLERDYPV